MPVAVIVCGMLLKNSSHMVCITGTICKGEIAHGLFCQAMSWITFGMKFQCHNVMLVPSRSWLFLRLLLHDPAEPCADESTVSIFDA